MPKNIRSRLLLSCFLLLPAASAWAADIVTMNDGSVVEGTVLEETADTLVKGRLTKEHLQAYVRKLIEHQPPLEALAVLSGMNAADLQAALTEKLKRNFEEAAPAAGEKK